MNGWILICGLGAGFALAEPACASQWFQVTLAGAVEERTSVEIDLDSIRLQAGKGAGVIRVSHDATQRHEAGFGYRSFTATAFFDCTRRAITLGSAAYYAQPGGEGPRVGADSSAREAGMPAGLLETIPSAARVALLRATCATAAGN